MLIRLRLMDEDRKALGLSDEWLTFDTDRLQNVEAADLEDQTGWTYPQWWAMFNKPTAKFWWSVVWLALGRVGITVPYADLRFDLQQMDVETNEGKEGPEETSEPSSEATSPGSSSSSE